MAQIFFFLIYENNPIKQVARLGMSIPANEFTRLISKFAHRQKYF